MDFESHFEPDLESDFESDIESGFESDFEFDFEFDVEFDLEFDLVFDFCVELLNHKCLQTVSKSVPEREAKGYQKLPRWILFDLSENMVSPPQNTLC